MGIPFYGNNPYAMGTQSPATMGMMRGMGVLANSPAGAPNMAVPGQGGQMQNLQAIQDGGGSMGQQMDPAMFSRLLQAMGGSGSMYPGR